MSKEWTAQEIFDTAYKAIIAQGRPAGHVKEAGLFLCLYRAADGAKCAFGHLIPDELYRPAMEGRDAMEVVSDLALKEFSDYVHLLNAVQAAHDDAAMEVCAVGATIGFIASFKQRMNGVAKRYRLTVPEIV